MSHILYKTTNKINGKYYIGVQNHINDNYLGSGVLLKKAIKKYGKENFKKEVLFIFDNKQDAFKKEREIVTEEFITRKETYNMRLGGAGGSRKGRTFTESTKKKMSNSAKRRKNSNGMSGKKLKPDQLAKISYKVSCQGVEYPSSCKAAKELNVSQQTIINRCRNDNFIDYFIVEKGSKYDY